MSAVMEWDERALPAIQADGPITPMGMIQMAVAQGADIEKLSKLMDLQERWDANEAKKSYTVAFAAFKSEAIQVLRNKIVTDGPLRGKAYAELFSVVDAVTPFLSKHGFSASWKLTKDEKDWLEVTCTLRHVQGHSESVSMAGPPDAGGAKSALQARASSVTFLERYTLKAVCGVAERGDDNNGGGGKGAMTPDAAGKAALEKCGSMNALKTAWEALTKEQRKSLAGVKAECQTRIQEAERAAQ